MKLNISRGLSPAFEAACREAGESADARFELALALNQRGIYTEALFQIKQALVTKPDDAFFLAIEAISLNGLHRYQDAIAASIAAIRASDGKYGWMYSQLGASYFELKDWNAAADSFKQAAELDRSDPESAYNVATSLRNAGFKREAITWYREAISRDPAFASKHEISGRIADLEKQLP